MGLFDALAKNALGSLLGGSTKQDPAALLSGLLSEAGGLQGLMSKFQNAGLGEHFASWVGHGENQSVSADDMQNAVGADALQGMATKLGMNVQTIGSVRADTPQRLGVQFDMLVLRGRP